MDVKAPRNPGPSGGYSFISACDRTLPRWLFASIMDTGTLVAFALMKTQRRYSREYLEAILKRPVNRRDSFRHFRALADMLMLKLRAGRGEPVPIQWADEENRLCGSLIHGEEPILLGTFHVGASDLLGFGLEQFDRPICMVRQRVGNSGDIDRLVRQSSSQVEVMWVNAENEIIFGLKEALEAGKTLALQCDRLEHTSKTAAFDFLGARRQFPVTIYRLAALYRRPVLFCLALPASEGAGYRVHTCRPFVPAGRSRREDIRAGREHFQGVLIWLEEHLRRHPFQWFNFLPLNPPESPS